MLYRFNNRQPATGKQTYVSNSAEIIGDVTIGDNCYIGHGAILRGDYGRIVIGNGTAVEEGAIIHAKFDDVCTIGNKVTIGHGAIVHAKIVHDMAVIGMGAVVSISSEIGAWAIVAEGCVVKMNQVIKPGAVVVGNPAHIARDINDKDIAFWEHAKQVYVDLAKKYLELGLEPLIQTGVNGK